MELDYELIKKYPNTHSERNIRLAYYHTYRRPSIAEIRAGIYFEYAYVSFNHVTHWRQGQSSNFSDVVLKELYNKHNLRTNMVLAEVDALWPLTMPEYKKSVYYMQKWSFDNYQAKYPDKVRLATKEQLNKFLEEQPMKKITNIEQLKTLLKENSLLFKYKDMKVEVFPKEPYIRKGGMGISFYENKVMIDGVDQRSLSTESNKELYDKWFTNKDESFNREWRHLLELDDSVMNVEKDLVLANAFIKETLYVPAKQKVWNVGIRGNINENIKVKANWTHEAYNKARAIYPSAEIEVYSWDLEEPNPAKKSIKFNSNRKKAKHYSRAIKKNAKFVTKFQKSLTSTKARDDKFAKIRKEYYSATPPRVKPKHYSQIVIHPTPVKQERSAHIRKICLKVNSDNKIIRMLYNEANELVKSQPKEYTIVSKQEWKAWKRDQPKPFNNGFHVNNAGELGMYNGISRNFRRGSFKNTRGDRLMRLQRVPLLVNKEEVDKDKGTPKVYKGFKTIKIYNHNKYARGIKVKKYNPRPAKQQREKWNEHIKALQVGLQLVDFQGKKVRMRVLPF